MSIAWFGPKLIGKVGRPKKQALEEDITHDKVAMDDLRRVDKERDEKGETGFTLV